ncbi:GntR family transcriptional regulator [Plantibacter sp. Leaf171]|uniref:GntR family transcriptional regulator n=1 Tax=unclassified Plantibacter TaxID=2624265 RepID=UPI0006F45226|nr:MULTISPECIES: GntR family transcriptional regulator [unclassified Plantibacter]KQM13547.1 GntR family transcriptional regulator [Plantibacter sp. Leaf1]KQR56656.1 GntR family transcriptional regulator [Plantibacter sp. Leaf171]
MPFRIEPTSGVAVFEQLRTQVIDGVREGSMPTGSKLPTVRGLADELGIAPNTVAKAYRLLEADGVIETRGRAGTFVSAHGDAIEQQAQRAAAAYADRIRELGVPADEALELVGAALRA